MINFDNVEHAVLNTLGFFTEDARNAPESMVTTRLKAAATAALAMEIMLGHLRKGTDIYREQAQIFNLETIVRNNYNNTMNKLYELIE